MNKKLHLVSLGCTKNLVDSEVMLGKLNSYEITDDAKNADVIIVNTCGFIESAKSESLQTVLDLHDQRKEDSVLVMSGCLSERYKEQLQKELTEVDIFTGVGDYDKIDELIAKKQNFFSPESYLIKDEKRVITGSNYHAYIKLSEGCNQQCSFCAIPSFKGKLKSRDLQLVVKEVEELVKQGFWDFSFISQDSSSYLRDFGVKDGLVQLIDKIEKIDGVKSARILYLYPSTLSDEMINAIIDAKKFHNYFEMPIQHISDNMLKIMRRGSGAKTIKHQLDLMKKAKDAFFRTSVIVGHPKESDEDFQEIKEFVKSFGFDRVSIFEYSDEEGTHAYNLEDKIPEKTVKQRIKQLEKVVEKNLQNSLEKDLNKIIDIVITGESSEGEFFLGAKKLLWAEDIDGEILINENETDQTLEVGKIYKAKVTEVVGENLLASIVRS